MPDKSGTYYMEIPDDILDKAYTIFAEWGPNLRIDRRERLKGTFQELSAEELDHLLMQMKDVNDTVWEIAEMGGESKIGELQVKVLLQAKHPFLQSEGLRQAMAMVDYYAWHEGYDK